MDFRVVEGYDTGDGENREEERCDNESMDRYGQEAVYEAPMNKEKGKLGKLAKGSVCTETKT